MDMLESEEVSRSLHHWIDLNFGHLLSGPAALAALNIPLARDDASVRTPLRRSCFVQLFSRAHPLRRCCFPLPGTRGSAGDSALRGVGATGGGSFGPGAGSGAGSRGAEALSHAHAPDRSFRSAGYRAGASQRHRARAAATVHTGVAGAGVGAGARARGGQQNHLEEAPSMRRGVSLDSGSRSEARGSASASAFPRRSVSVDTEAGVAVPASVQPQQQTQTGVYVLRPDDAYCTQATTSVDITTLSFDEALRVLQPERLAGNPRDLASTLDVVQDDVMFVADAAASIAPVYVPPHEERAWPPRPSGDLFSLGCLIVELYAVCCVFGGGEWDGAFVVVS